MKKKNLFLLIAGLFLIFIVIVSAVDFTPQGNINLRGLYNITNLAYIFNFTLGGNIDANSQNITSADYITANYFTGDGSGITNVPGTNISWNQSFADNLYWGIALGSYNATYAAYATNVSKNYTLDTFTNWNDIWLSTYNATYANSVTWDADFNASFDARDNDTSYNATYAAYATNVSKNYTLDTYNNWNTVWLSTYNVTYHNYVVANFSNKSNYWDNMNTINATQMEDSGGILNILVSWLTELFYEKDEVYNKTESDDINTSMGNYVDAQDVIYNDSATAYTDSKLITEFFNATNVNPVTGTPAGTVVDLRDKNDITYNLSEVSSDMELIINFSGITDFNQIIYRYKSDATESHMISVQVWDYPDSFWENFDHLGNTENEYIIRTATMFDDENHIGTGASDGVVQVRFYSNNAGGSTHLHQFDWVSISKGAATPSGDETDPHAIHSDGMISFAANWDQGAFNLTNTDSWFLGKINHSNVQNHPADADTTYTNGSGISLIGTEFNHSDTSSQASDDNSGNTFIQDIVLDTYGHITSLVNAAVDFSSYWDTSNDIDTVISADEISEANIAFSTACASGNHYYLNGNDLACEADDTGGDMNDLVDDTSPQLGGYLDTNTQNIGSTSDEIENIYVGLNTRIYFGDGQESSIYYNGTALIIG